MKKTFVSPELQVILLQNNDIVTLSVGTKAGDNDMIVDLGNIAGL